MPTKEKPLQRTNSGTEIGLAELIIAVETLGYDNEEHVAEYLRCLGFQKMKSSNILKRDYPSTQLAANARDNKPIVKKRKSQYSPPVSAPPAPQPSLSTSHAESEFKELSPLNTTETSTENMPESFDAISIIQEEETPIAPVKRAPIFPHLKSRGLITEMVSRPVSGNDIDIARLIKWVVQQNAITRLPKLPHISTQNGCQLMLDLNSALMPLWPDMRELVKQFETLLDNTKLQIYEFEDSPFDAVHWNHQDKEIQWKPALNVPLILVSDLGIKESPDYNIRPGKKTWQKLAAVCKQKNASLIVLTPLEQRNIPDGLPAWIKIVRWSSTTTATDIKCLHYNERRKIS